MSGSLSALEVQGPPSSVPRVRFADLIRKHKGTWTRLPRTCDVRFTYSGRAAIYQYLALLRRVSPSSRTRVLVPSFHCPTLVDPVLHAGFAVRFYRIDTNLEIDAEDLLAKLDRRTAAVIFVRYFGFGTIPAVLGAACREQGARIIEDCCHSFLATNPLRLLNSGADAAIYSFWKLLPTQVGGGVLVAQPLVDMWPTQTRPRRNDSFTRAKHIASELAERIGGGFLSRVRGLGRSNGIHPPIPAIRKPASEAYPYDAERSSWKLPMLARLILQTSDLEWIAAARRRNFETLRSRLDLSDEITPLYHSTGPTTCPWGFPVLLKRRGERDYLIRSRGVPVFTFGEVLHPLLFEVHRGERKMLEEAAYLADSILALAIHQDFEEDQIASFAEIINAFFRQQ